MIRNRIRSSIFTLSVLRKSYSKSMKSLHQDLNMFKTADPYVFSYLTSFN